MRCNSRAELVLLLLAVAEIGEGAGRFGPEGSAQVEGGTSNPEFRSGKNGPGDAASDGVPSAGVGDLTEAASMWAKETLIHVSAYETGRQMAPTRWVCLVRACRLCDALVVIILNFYDLYTLVFGVLWAVSDKQALVTADKWRGCAMTVDVLPITVSRATKDAGQELEDAIDSVLLTLVSFACGQSFLPEVLIGSFEFVEVGGNCLLMALNGSDPSDDRIDVQDLRALAWDGHLTTVRKLGSLLTTTFAVLPSDEAEEIGLPAVEMRVLEVPKFGFGIALEDTLLEVWYLVESVHVQLADKRREVSMLEKSREDVVCKALMLKD